MVFVPNKSIALQPGGERIKYNCAYNLVYIPENFSAVRNRLRFQRRSADIIKAMSAL
jgi:hypothetical protein